MPHRWLGGGDGEYTEVLTPRDHNQQASGAQLTTVAGSRGQLGTQPPGGSVIKLPFPDVLKGERQELEASPAVELVLELHPGEWEEESGHSTKTLGLYRKISRPQVPQAPCCPRSPDPSLLPARDVQGLPSARAHHTNALIWSQFLLCPAQRKMYICQTLQKAGCRKPSVGLSL